MEIAAVDAPKFEPVMLEGSEVRLEPLSRAHEPLLWDVAKDHLEEIFAGFRIPCGRTAVNTEAKYLMLRHAFEKWKCNGLS